MRLGEAINEIGHMLKLVDLFGQTPEFRREFKTRLGALGQIIAEENGLSRLSDPPGLPHATQLGERSLATFRGLKEWFRANSATGEKRNGNQTQTPC